MAFRSHTQVYKDIRDQFFANKRNSSGSDEETTINMRDSKRLLSSREKEGVGDDIIEETTLEGIEGTPEWLKRIQPIGSVMQSIKSKTDELSKWHASQLLASFHPKVEEERRIEILTSEITRLFKMTKDEIKNLGRGYKLNQQEMKVRDNVQQLLAAKLQDLSSGFKKTQKDYLDKLQRNERTRSTMPTFDNDSGDEETDDDPSIYDKGFTPDQLQQMKANNKQIKQREDEIRQIAKSINELAEIFKDMAQLVHDQGSILDRIDYNIEKADKYVEEAGKELKAAAKEESSGRRKYLILLLIILVTGSAVALIIRLSN